MDFEKWTCLGTEKFQLCQWGHWRKADFQKQGHLSKAFADWLLSTVVRLSLICWVSEAWVYHWFANFLQHDPHGSEGGSLSLVAFQSSGGVVRLSLMDSGLLVHNLKLRPKNNLFLFWVWKKNKVLWLLLSPFFCFPWAKHVGETTDIVQNFTHTGTMVNLWVSHVPRLLCGK